MFLRKWLLAVVAVLSTAAWCAAPHARNVIIVTADGLRWQEVFRGIDPLLMNEKTAGMADAGALRKRLWRETPEARRAALMPFFWSTLVRKGVVLGNPDRNSSIKVTNAYRVSYPGYSEILTGRAQDDTIRGNAAIQNPSETVLEFLRSRLGLAQSQVALFGSWDMFPFIGESRPGTVFINAGRDSLGERATTPRLRELDDLQFRVLMADQSMRHDYITFEMGLEYLRATHPRVLHIALGETDDWAHERHYDRVLDMISEFDRYLRELWDFLENSPEYRGNTVLVLTCDHGRGSTLEDWDSHGEKVPEAARIWAAFFGPGVPAMGEAANKPAASQRDIAPTVLELLGIHYTEYKGATGRPIRFVLPSGE